MTDSKDASRLSAPCKVKKVDITSNEPANGTTNLVGGLVYISYHESLLSDTVSSVLTFTDTGSSDVSVIEKLPIVTEEQVDIEVEDNRNQKLKLQLFVNEVTPQSDDTRKTQIKLKLVSEEFIRNEKTRITERFDGKISDSVKRILSQGNDIGLKSTKDFDNENTKNTFNFVGNNKKPFYVINWLARKCVSEKNQTLGKSAGYFFYETSEGFHFKSIDGLFSQKKKRSIIYNDSPRLPEGFDDKAMTYVKDNRINAQEKLKIGAYSTRTVLFDPFTCYYEVVTPNAEKNEDELKLAGQKLPKLNDRFKTSGKNKEFSRTSYFLLDKGVLPDGNTDQQLTKSKDQNFDYEKIQNQSIMRYNQFFSATCDIVIPGDFSLHAGDAIFLSVPKLDKKKPDSSSQQDSGLYIISELTHYIHITEGTYTKLTLARDSFGKKGKSSNDSLAEQ